MDDLMFGLKLTVIGMSVVFSILFGLEVFVRITAKIWGPKEAPRAPQEAPPWAQAEKAEG